MVVAAHPEAAVALNHANCTPLHIAMENKLKEDATVAILTACPAAAKPVPLHGGAAPWRCAPRGCSPRRGSRFLFMLTYALGIDDLIGISKAGGALWRASKPGRKF